MHYDPEKALTDADLGYEGSAPDALDSRFDFNENGRVVWPNTYWEDLRVPVTSVKVQGASNTPDWGAFLTGLQLLWFDNSTMEQVFFVVQMPHSWKEGSDICPHIHWVPSINGAQEAHTVKWGVEYSWANEGATFPSTSTGTGNMRQPDEQLVANRHYYTCSFSKNCQYDKHKAEEGIRLLREKTIFWYKENRHDE